MAFIFQKPVDPHYFHTHTTMFPTQVIFSMMHAQSHCQLTHSPSTPPKSLQTFHPFPNLPPEIRLKIWHLIASEPQTVELSCTPTTSTCPTGQWFSHSRPPVIFRICWESRHIALQKFTLLTFSPDQIGIPWKKKLYINFESGTLWLCSDLHEKWAGDLLVKNKELREGLRVLAVGERTWKKVCEGREVREGGVREDGGYDWPKKGGRCVKGGLKALQDVRFHS